MSQKSQRVLLKSQARELVSKEYDFMKNEAGKNYAEKITDARLRSGQAVGVSESTDTRILRERKKRTNIIIQTTISTTESNTSMETDATENEANTSNSIVSRSATVFTLPMKKRRMNPRKNNLDEFDIGLVR